MVEEAPRVDWRRLRGGNSIAQATEPRPPFLERRSTSEGDMRRGSYRESMYDDHFTLAVVNDNGRPITAGVEGLLAEVLVELKLFNRQFAEMLGRAS